MEELTPVERAVARDEIRQLAARYAVALDSRDLDGLVALFVDDVRVGRAQHGRGALRQFYAESLARIAVSVLNVGTHVIEVQDATRARGLVYCRAELQIDDRWVVQLIQYRDDYERRHGQWLFVRREHLLWYGREVGTSPVGLAPANWPEHDTGWGVFPEAWSRPESPGRPRSGSGC